PPWGSTSSTRTCNTSGSPLGSCTCYPRRPREPVERVPVAGEEGRRPPLGRVGTPPAVPQRLLHQLGARIHVRPPPSQEPQMNLQDMSTLRLKRRYIRALKWTWRLQPERRDGFHRNIGLSKDFWMWRGQAEQAREILRDRG